MDEGKSKSNALPLAVATALYVSDHGFEAEED